MREMRMLVISEDYDESVLVMTDLENDEIKTILEQTEVNNEDGLGITFTECCNTLFPKNTLVELGGTWDSGFEYITDLDTTAICWSSYFTASVVKSAE